MMPTILVIDDDDQVRSMLRDMLEFEGYHVIDAANGRQGISSFQQQPVDLVITDILMPEKEGLETIIELRKSQPGLQIIAISGGGARSNMDYLLSADMLGATKTFSKPVDRKELLSAIALLLRQAPGTAGPQATV
jgi:DNA-binding response OmpR family regulator